MFFIGNFTCSIYLFLKTKKQKQKQNSGEKLKAAI